MNAASCSSPLSRGGDSGPARKELLVARKICPALHAVKIEAFSGRPSPERSRRTKERDRIPNIYNDYVNRRAGRSLRSSQDGRGGKSELHRAVCRITSGTPLILWDHQMRN